MRSLGGYELITRLGSGTSAEVFLGRARLGAGELLAVKTVKPELVRTPGFVGTLTRERDAAIALRHPAAARLEAVDVVERGTVIFAMEPVFGHTFSQILQLASLTHTPVPAELWLHLAREVASALDAAENQRHEGPPIRHGALSSHAVMISYEGSVKLLGLGTGRSRALLPTALHTLAYQAPEVVEGGPRDGLSDLYALGVLLYDALTGGRVFRRRTAAETRAAILEHEVPPLLRVVPSVSKNVASLIDAMMAKKRADRPESARLVSALLSQEIRTDASELGRDLASLLALWFEDDRRASRRLIDASLRAGSSSRPPSRPSSRPGPSPSDLGSAPPAPQEAPFDPDEGLETISLPRPPAEPAPLKGAVLGESRPPLPALQETQGTKPSPLSAEEIHLLALDLLKRLSAPPESHDAPTSGRSTSVGEASTDGA